MFPCRFRPRTAKFVTALLAGAAGLAGCAMEGLDSVPYAWEEGRSALFATGSADETGSGFDNGLYDNEIGRGFDDRPRHHGIGPRRSRD